MSRRRAILTSAASGVGIAVQQAASVSPHRYEIVGISSQPARLLTGSPARPCPPTRYQYAFQRRVLTLVEEVAPCLVVAGRDEDASVLAQVADELAALGGMLGTGPAYAVQAAYDKAATNTLFADSELSMAATVASLPDALRLAEVVGWPVMIKPRYGNASRGVRLATDTQSLRSCFRPNADIAQEFLALDPLNSRPWDGGAHSGGQDGEYSVQVLIGRRGEDLGSFVSRNNLIEGVPRLIETDAGPSGAEVARHALDALRQFGAWGAWNLQGRCAPDGSIRIFEVNARFTGLTGLRAWLGFNELDQVYETLVLQQHTSRAPAPPPGLLVELSTPNGRLANSALPGREEGR